ncbi:MULTISPECIES: LacI family DNA-binding transcriptional regulator [Enterobacterales]|uniref:LacI family DNA-binding transcriptional regulator n=1 Tax=Enterobacterales TaxID=91347 RepID=UPI002EDA3C03
MNTKNKITIKSLAKLLGVSHTTVSNAWNNPEKLSSELREQILNYAQKRGFQGPDKLARALRTGRADAVGIIFNDAMSYVFIDQHDINLMRGIASACEQENINLVLIPLHHSNNMNATPVTTLVDGYILNATYQHEAIIQQTLAQKRPVVTLDFSLPEHSSVSINNARAMQEIVEYLIAKGHQNFGIIAFPSSKGMEGMQVLTEPLRGDNAVMITRVNACFETLAAHGLREHCWLHQTQHDEEHGADAAKALLQAYPHITALVCLSDRFAAGAVRYCTRNNIMIPQQVAITGFDNTTVETQGIGLTTIAQDAMKKGRIALELLLNKGTVTHHELEYQFIVRESA